MRYDADGTTTGVSEDGSGPNRLCSASPFFSATQRWNRKTPTVANSGGVEVKYALLQNVNVLVLPPMISVVCAPRPAPVYINITPVPRQGRDVFVPSVSGGDVTKLFI